ncbi:CPBP family glutamic-type intramembrane protease, partial [Bacillus cereus]|nr:CPBP family intramembrane metalloprotease [Bacillus cereus]
GLAHGAWVLLRGELKVALPIILSTTVLGGLLAFVYIISERHILAPIVTHILINLMIEPWLMLSAISQKWNVKSFKDK